MAPKRVNVANADKAQETQELKAAPLATAPGPLARPGRGLWTRRQPSSDAGSLHFLCFLVPAVT